MVGPCSQFSISKSRPDLKVVSCLGARNLLWNNHRMGSVATSSSRKQLISLRYKEFRPHQIFWNLNYLTPNFTLTQSMIVICSKYFVCTNRICHSLSQRNKYLPLSMQALGNKLHITKMVHNHHLSQRNVGRLVTQTPKNLRVA